MIVRCWRSGIDRTGGIVTCGASHSRVSSRFAFHRGPPLELEAELTKEVDRHLEIFDNDADVVQLWNRHGSNPQAVV